MSNLFIGVMASPLAIQRFKMVQSIEEDTMFYDRSNMRVYDKNLVLIESLNFKGLYHLASFLFLLRIISKHKIKLLHFHGVSVQLLSLTSYLTNLKIIATPQGSDINQNFRGKHAFFTRKLLNNSDFVTVKSQEMLNRVKEISQPKKTIFLNWGVNNEFNISKFNRNNRINIISPRTNAPNYNVDIIFKVMKQIKANYSNVNFIFVSLLNNVENIIDLNIADEVRFNLNSKEMAELYSKSDIMISIPDNDGFATSILESLMCGCLPVISDISSYTSINDIMNIACKVKKPYDKSLYETLEYIIKNIEIIREGAIDRQEFIESIFSRNKQIEVLASVYKD